MRVAFTTLGCRLNLYETEAMRRRAREHAHASVVAWEDEAEIYVINSCTVTSRAEQKCRQMARSVKRKNPGCKVMVVGCYSQVKGRSLVELPEIDVALGTEEKKEIERYLPLAEAGHRLAEAAPFPKALKSRPDEWITGMEGRSRGMIKVQEGCNLRCTFCAVWSARGPSRSRPPREILQQASLLAKGGYEEIVLGGVHVGHYGRDLLPRIDLKSLLEVLLEKVDDRVRFRLSSIDPSEVDPDLAAMLAQEPRLCRYLHLPLQSGSDEILRKMRRPYSSAYYRDLVEEIARIDPDFGIGADVIVGFPGEGERAFEETMALLESLPVSFYHVFPYSNREGTPAAAMSAQVDGRVAARRGRLLRELGDRKRRAFLQRHLHRRFEGVVEGTGRKGVAEGLREVMIDNYATVWVAADSSWEGKRVMVDVSGWSEEGNLLGRLVKA